MRILAIETSCDDTALSLVDCQGDLQEPKFKIIKNVISSQVETHRPFGGVVPNLAKREHLKNLPKLLKQLNLDMDEIDALAITVGPGLAPALWAGVNFAQDLAKEIGKPLLGANHLKGHIYSPLLPGKINEVSKRKIEFPALALLVSGGHTILAKVDGLDKIKKLGETRDDAVGEAFDKVAKLIGLEYPGGPEIERLAKEWQGELLDFPRPMLNSADLDFSFSGLKTAIRYFLVENPDTDKAQIAASFQATAIELLLRKTRKAIDEVGAQSLILGGGVAANQALKTALEDLCEDMGVKFYTPTDFSYNTDNAAMIAVAAYIDHLQGIEHKIEAQPNLNL